jgi:hypothetical protein
MAVFAAGVPSPSMFEITPLKPEFVASIAEPKSDI